MFYLRFTAFAFVISIVLLAGCDDRGTGEGTAEESLAGTSRLATLLRSEEAGAYRQVLTPRQFEFPIDHGPHPGYRNEWWYFTGNLDSSSGRRFGFELTIFRFALAAGAPANADSAWRTNQVYIGHFAITDVEAGGFHVAQRYARGGAGLAGAVAHPFRVWVEDWSVQASPEQDSAGDSAFLWQLVARAQEFALELELVPEKAVVLQGEAGLSQKSPAPGDASYYYSIPRLRAAGQLTVGGETYDVSGLAWLDREWSSSGLAADQEGWDWFALQLSDGSDLMFYQLRGVDGGSGGFSAGTWIDAIGKSTPLARDEVTIEVTAYWNSPRGGRYPAGWRIVIPGQRVSLMVTPVIADQELAATVRYWEGAVDVAGTAAGERITGRGYVELTGYAEK